jgi:N-acetylmuramoyl-L-alanine amidase
VYHLRHLVEGVHGDESHGQVERGNKIAAMVAIVPALGGHMPKVFVAPGHGLGPDPHHPGQMIFDPGAVGHAGGREFIEHDFNTKVANALAAALQRCGVQVQLEQGGGNHDPDFIGSTKAANAFGADYAIEIHHNASGGTGSEVLVNDRASAANRQLAAAIAAAVARALGIRNRGVIARDREHFNRETTMPACIPECAFVDSATDQAVIDQAGYAAAVAEAICEPLCGFLGVAFHPGQTALLTTPEEDIDMATGDQILDAIHELRGKIGDLRQDLTVVGTPGLPKTVADFASRQRDALKKLDDLNARLTKVEQHLGIPS